MKKNKYLLMEIISIIILVFLIGLLIIYILNKNMVPVLAYHSVVPKEYNTGDSSVIKDLETFEKEIKYLKKRNYKSMTLDEYYCWKVKACKKNYKSVLITFDDGYVDNYEYAFDILKKYDMNAVVFLIGSYAFDNVEGFISAENLNKIRQEYPNIEFASHSYNQHDDRPKTYEAVTSDINIMTEKIEKFEYFAYPHGDYNDEYIKALKDSGYKMAFTFGPGKEHRKSTISDDNYKVPRLNVSNNLPMWKFILRMELPI